LFSDGIKEAGGGPTSGPDREMRRDARRSDQMDVDELEEHLGTLPWIWWILNDQAEPVPIRPTLEAMARWSWQQKHDERWIVRRQTVEMADRSVLVSTVFLGIDHGGFGDEKPALWETMTFGLPCDAQAKYTSREAAIEGHNEIVRQLGGQALG